MSDELQLGPLRLRAPTSWTFFPFENLILACTDSRIGNLQITLAYANAAPVDADHDVCHDVLRQFMGEQEAGAEGSRQTHQKDAMFGEVTCRDAETFSRYWYRHKRGRLLFAVYQCDALKLDKARKELDQAAAIAATMELTAGQPQA